MTYNDFQGLQREVTLPIVIPTAPTTVIAKIEFCPKTVVSLRFDSITADGYCGIFKSSGLCHHVD